MLLKRGLVVQGCDQQKVAPESVGRGGGTREHEVNSLDPRRRREYTRYACHKDSNTACAHQVRLADT